MNTLVSETGQTMTSQEIAELCEARHNDVVTTIARLYEQGVLRDRRKTPRPYTPDGGGRPTMVYDVSYRDCMVIVSGYRPEVRAKIIDRWLELEKQAAPQLPQSFAQALRLAAEQAETIEAQNVALAAAQPSIEFVAKYADSTGLKGFRQVCKLLGAKENDFREFLADKKIMYRLGGEWVPHAAHLDAGRFEVKAGTSDTSGHAYNSARFTPKGVAWVAGEYAKHKLELA